MHFSSIMLSISIKYIFNWSTTISSLHYIGIEHVTLPKRGGDLDHLLLNREAAWIFNLKTLDITFFCIWAPRVCGSHWEHCDNTLGIQQTFGCLSEWVNKYWNLTDQHLKQILQEYPRWNYVVCPVGCGYRPILNPLETVKIGILHTGQKKWLNHRCWHVIKKHMCNVMTLNQHGNWLDLPNVINVREFRIFLTRLLT